MSDDECFGPALPPGFTNSRKEETKQKSNSESRHGIGPQLPPNFGGQPAGSSSDEEAPCIGPLLPSHLKSSHTQSQSSNAKKDTHSISQSKSPESLSTIGPSLPPHLSAKFKCSDDNDSRTDSIGPCLPSDQSSFSATKDDNVIGPSLPPHLQRNTQSSSSREGEEDDDDSDLIGPLPTEMTAGNSQTSFSAEFERRAQKMRDHLDGKNEPESQPKRESWMTELPDCLGQNIGLTARTFRANAGPDMSDRSMWTDSPADRARKEKEGNKGNRKRSHNEAASSSRDQQIKSEVDKFNKNRGTESLLDMHQKKMKKKMKEEENKPKERRPFDRDLDLQANRFDEAQRKSIIKKSQNLNSRFSHGKGSQYL
ncbi:GPALPP motifs-containing protein 1-like [Saccostrea echinata]|uniref:GPALPP motifs-containing protein 1-like n=1 Tax=Saccostrea echinata TaxID=191078 RepID=UPI002A7F5512|nr:GPALPP motifs-containing protein 1-like [Saccostrea echinata]XP_061189513.1 GPALPP motifs-containing protein 1-like [Saccostrea echinata]